MQNSLSHVPEGKWAFDESVADCFDDMLARSIPDYDGMRRLVSSLASHHLADNTYVVDLGCSLGAQLEPLIARHGAYARYLGVDCSEAMLARARERPGLKPYLSNGLLRLESCDLRREFPRVRGASVFLSVLTLQFTPIEYRVQLVRKVYESLRPGGVFLVVEKLFGQTAEADALFTRLYYERKGESGYSSESVRAKRESLEGVLVPLSARMNEQLLSDAGFARVECFWRWLNFAGFLAVR